MGKEEGVLVIRRVHVDYRLVSGDADHETIARVHDMHHDFCPVYRSLQAAIEITTSYELESD